jgi:hypothetical protein
MKEEENKVKTRSDVPVNTVRTSAALKENLMDIRRRALIWFLVAIRKPFNTSREAPGSNIDLNTGYPY